MSEGLFYHITGSVQALIFFFSLAALLVQANAIRARKQVSAVNKSIGSTDVLSINLILSSFCAFFSYLLYGASLERFNYYLVLTRVPACLITIYLVFEISLDRKTLWSRVCFWGCSVAFAGVCVALAIDQGSFQGFHRILSNFVVVCGVLMLQGQAHQIFSIVRAKSTGAISFRARFLNVLKDLSTVLFAVAMGVRDGWPIILVNGVNAIMTLIVLRSFDRYGPNAQAHLRTSLPTDSQRL
jgi:uncharacterized protein with PQ loop repeat